MIRVSKALAAGALACLLAAGAQAQVVQSHVLGGPGATPYREDPGTALARHLRSLDDNPDDLSALVAAGDAAVLVGDLPGAASLFARAEAIAPQDGRVKAGMGAVLTHSLRPDEALVLFGEAVALGVPARTVARERGLAYDMTGDQARAQADYALVLRAGSDAEVERRLALSRAIAGDRAGALAVLDPQLRRQDRAGWRTRAFVLALTGDAAGAQRLVESMLPGQAAALAPFFARLPQLRPIDRVMAVHFGRFPAAATRLAVAAPAPAPAAVQQSRPAAPPAARGGTAGRPAPPRASTGTASRLAVDIREPIGVRMADAQARARVRVEPTASPAPSRDAPPSIAAAGPPPPIKLLPDPAPSRPARTPAGTAISSTATVTAQAPAPAAGRAAPPAGAGLSDIAALVAALPDTPPSAVRPAPPAAARPKPATRPPAAVEAERIWVQLASGQDRTALPQEFRRLKAKAAAPIGARAAWTAPSRASHRLLVGPFKTGAEARTLVNALAKVDVASFVWTSEAGEKIDKLPAR